MPIDYRAALHSEAARFVDVLSEADLTARVPTCPHWRVDDLLYHLAETFLFWGERDPRTRRRPGPDRGRQAREADGAR